MISFLSILLVAGCLDSEDLLPKDMQVYSGQIEDFTSESCGHSMNIDVLQSGNKEPLMFTTTDANGRFTLSFPKTSNPLTIHGFCYPTGESLETNTPSWSTEPYLLLPTQITSTTLKLTRATGGRSSEPAIQESMPTEYSTWVQNPLLVQYYGLRFPDHQLTTSGSVPEIRQGGLTTQAQLTHIFATIGFIQSNSDPYLQDLLLPTQSDLAELTADLSPTAVKLQITRQLLSSACAALELQCPSVNALRQQTWVLKDKSGLTNPELVQKRAALWFKGHHFIQTLLDTGRTLPNAFPLPSDYATITSPKDAEPINQRWNTLYQEYQIAIPKL